MIRLVAGLSVIEEGMVIITARHALPCFLTLSALDGTPAVPRIDL